MAEYIMLFRFTKAGVEKIKESPARIKAAKKLFEAHGAKIKTFYAVLGEYDTVCIVEAPDDETIARLSLLVSAQGNVHPQTLRAFSEEEFAALVSKIS